MIGAASFVLAASWGNQRFRLAAEPALAVLAAIALSALWSRLSHRDDSSRQEQERSGDTPNVQSLA